MADCERALGRPDRALAIINDPGVSGLDREVQIELRIVESGIRRDEGRPAAAAVALQVPELTDGRLRPWSARLFYAYADALLDAGRAEEARDWFGRAAAADTDGETDAAERFEDLDTAVLEDLAATDDGTGPARRPTRRKKPVRPPRTLTQPRRPAQPARTDADPAAEDASRRTASRRTASPGGRPSRGARRPSAGGWLAQPGRLAAPDAVSARPAPASRASA